MFDIWGGLRSLVYVPLLLTNAVAILNEERFLAKIGLSSQTSPAANSGFGNDPSFNNNNYGDGPGMKIKTIQLINSVRTLMRPPLVVINILVILYEILLG